MSITQRTNGDWRTNTLPMTICGASGAGKTTTARALHYEFPGVSIIFNLDHEPDMGTIVESVDELARALAGGADRVDVRPPETVVDEPELFEEVVRYLLQLGNELRNAGTGQVQFVMDEAQDLQPKWMLVAMKRLRKRRIKPVAMTQDPVGLDNGARKVADYNCWLSPPPSKMADDLSRVGYPVDLIEQLPQYDMLVFGDGWQALTRFRAPEEYAR